VALGTLWYSSNKMASRRVNKVILLGHLGKDAETKFTPSGTSLSTFNLATNRRVKDQQTGEWKDETDWHRCILWKSENVSNYLQKGKQVYLEGRLQTRSFDDKDGQKRYMTEVVCEELILLSGNREGAGPSDFNQQSYSQQPVSMPRSQRPSQPAAAPSPDETFGQGITDDDVPF
jgi:single-strand DNA-binding protein